MARKPARLPDGTRISDHVTLGVLTSGLDGQPAGSKPRDEGRLGRLSDPAGRNASEA